MKKTAKNGLKKRERHSFPVRQFNISDENWEWLKKQKEGTWNQTFIKILTKVYGNGSVSKVSGEKLEIPSGGRMGESYLSVVRE